MTATILETPAIAPGLYPNMPMEQYHAISAASNSRLGKLRRSPAHLQAYLAEPPADTKSTRIGRAAHMAVLEPDLFHTSFTVSDTCVATVKATGNRCVNGGVLYDANEGWLCGVHGKGKTHDDPRLVVPYTEYQDCQSMRDSVRAHPKAKALLAGIGEFELSVVWESSGVLCKGRYDRLSQEVAGGVIVDIKTCDDARPEVFEKKIYEYNYFMQAALYIDAAEALGIQAEHYAIIAVEKQAPFACSVHRLTEGAIDAGRDLYKALLARYAECTERNEWPAYPNEINDVALPDWAWGRIDAEIKALSGVTL